MSGFKKDMAGMYYIINPNGDRIDIIKSDNGWESGGSHYKKLSDAKAEIIQKIQDGGSGYSEGGLATKKYMNPVTVVDNRKNK
jgi:hypothetical protein